MELCIKEVYCHLTLSILSTPYIISHKAGHAEVRACPMPDDEDATVATQECFDSNPLTFVRDVCWGGPGKLGEALAGLWRHN